MGLHFHQRPLNFSNIHNLTFEVKGIARRGVAVCAIQRNEAPSFSFLNQELSVQDASRKYGDHSMRGTNQNASSVLYRPSSPSAMISSTVTWCRPTVKPLPTKFAPAWLDPELLPPPPPEPGPLLTNSRRESKNFLMVSRRRQMSVRGVNVRWTACSLCTELLHWQWCGTDWNPKRPVHQPFGAQYHAVMSFPVMMRRRMMMMLRQPKFLGKFPFTCQGKPVGESLSRQVM